jgi:dolichol-phosphate mannosyltransferase
MLSIVIPVYNEQDSLAELLSRIDSIARQHSFELDVLLIDDGSSDNSWSKIEELSQKFPWARGVRFRRNFGKSAALAAGFERAKGQRIITMDADLQDDPREIPNLLAKLESGFDVVSGWKKVRHDPWHKVLPSRVFNSMISWLTGVQLHDHNCGLKGYRREVLSEVLLYGEMHRFIPVLAASRGFRVSEIVIEHHARKHGKSKYGFERFINRPQHLLGTAGLVSFLFGGFGLFVLSLMWIISRLTQFDDVHLHEKAIFYYCIVALLLGVQLISMGFLAELITAQNRPTRKPFSIVADTAPDAPDRERPA